MESLASLDPLHKQGYRRFSVGVWRSPLSSAEGQYWVGIQLYWSGGMEFFDYHFTDDIRYHNEWKKTVAPECRRRCSAYPRAGRKAAVGFVRLGT